MTDSEVQADMDNVDKNWTAYLHTLWILYSAGSTIIGTIKASSSWSKSKSKMGGPA